MVNFRNLFEEAWAEGIVALCYGPVEGPEHRCVVKPGTKSIRVCMMSPGKDRLYQHVGTVEGKAIFVRE